MDEKKIIYVEPANFIPEEIRRELKIGEFEETEREEKNKD